MSLIASAATTDIGLLVDALNRRRALYFPDGAAGTPAAFKRLICYLHWLSTHGRLLSGADPIGVLDPRQAVFRYPDPKIAVHPDDRRQGHGNHLLTSLGSKLAILGPPRIIAEVPRLSPMPAGVERKRIRPGSAADRLCLGMKENHAGREAAGFVIPVTCSGRSRCAIISLERRLPTGVLAAWSRP